MTNIKCFLNQEPVDFLSNVFLIQGENGNLSRNKYESRNKNYELKRQLRLKNKAIRHKSFKRFPKLNKDVREIKASQHNKNNRF